MCNSDALLEVAFLDYVERFGLTEKAREYYDYVSIADDRDYPDTQGSDDAD